MKYKLVIFDFDGTLADTYPWFISITNKIADKFQLKRVDPNEVDTLKGYSAMKVIKTLGIPFWKIPQIEKYIRSLMAKDIEKIQLFEGVNPLIQKLSGAGITLALTSSNTYNNIARVFGTDNLSTFDFYECGVSLFGKVSKLKKILKKSGIDNKDAIYIGDEVRDIEAAKQADIASGAVSWGFNKVQALEETSPTELFSHIDEIGESLA